MIARAEGRDSSVGRACEKLEGEAEKNANGQTGDDHNAAELQNGGEPILPSAAGARG